MAKYTQTVDSAFPYSLPKLNDGFQAGFSKREMAAIFLKVPDSGTEWLDKMIIRSHKLEHL